MMTRDHKFAAFSDLEPAAALGDCVHFGECQTNRSSSSMEYERIFSHRTNLNQCSLAVSCAMMQPPASHDPSLCARSDPISEMDWTIGGKLSALLQNNLYVSDSVNYEAGSIVHSCNNRQSNFAELERQSIDSFLPDDDDLFAVAPLEFDGNVSGSYLEENEELDLFSSGGGLELDNDTSNAKSCTVDNAASSIEHGSSVWENSLCKRPSRTLFVGNLNSRVEDSELRALFEQFGDICSLHTACKHRGFVMISYYDIRAAKRATLALQNKVLRQQKLDIHFSIPKGDLFEKDVNQGTLAVFNLDTSVSNENLRQIFGVYGEVKEIRETPHKIHPKFIEFYDVRSAEAALKALNRYNIAGKRMKLELSCPGNSCSQPQKLALEPEQEDNNFLRARNSISLPKFVPVKRATSDASFFERSPVNEEDCQSLRFMGGGWHQPSPSLQTHSLSEHRIATEPTQIMASAAAISAMKAQIYSEHLARMAGGITENMQANSFLASNLNGVPKKANYPSFLSQTSARPPHGMEAFAPSDEVMRCSHALGFPRPPRSQFNTGSAPVTAFPILEINKSYVKDFPDPLSTAGSLDGGLEFGERQCMGFSRLTKFDRCPSGPVLSSRVLEQNARSCTWSILQQQKGNSNYMSRTVHDSFAKHSDRVLEHGRIRKTDSGVSHQDKKQYELDIQVIVRGEDSRTTLMIKNIPNKYTSKMLLAAIDEHHRGTYDFIYLPIDFKNKCNVGYAFINMTEPSRIIPFYQAFNGKRWEKFNSEKVAALAYARIQGKAALIAHFQNSSLMNEDKRCRPILFHSEGPNAGGQLAPILAPA